MDFTPPSSSKIFSSIHCIDVVVILVAEVANQQCEPRAHSLGHITELSRKQMLLRLLQGGVPSWAISFPRVWLGWR